jgi:hypothetical protein
VIKAGSWLLVIGAQLLACLEQAIGQMPSQVVPGDRRLGDVLP